MSLHSEFPIRNYDEWPRQAVGRNYHPHMEAKATNPLRTLRKAKGWSLEELTRRSGVPKSTLSRIENGLQEPGASILVNIANALGLDDLAELASQWTR